MTEIASEWPLDIQDEFYERCAILEYDAKQTRANAMLQAFQQMQRKMRK